MTKKLTVEEQIEEAKRDLENWPDWRKEAAQLEGSDPYIEKAKKNVPSGSEVGSGQHVEE
jgi:hypothetical protein